MKSAKKIEENTYRMLSKLFNQRNEWTKTALMGVLMGMEDVYSGGRLIQRWLNVQVSLGRLEEHNGVYIKNELQARRDDL